MPVAIKSSKNEYTVNLGSDDLLHHTFLDDVQRISPLPLIPLNVDQLIPKIIPSYTVIKYVELCCLAASRQYIDENGITLGTEILVKSFASLFMGDRIKIIVESRIKFSKVILFNVEIIRDNQLVTTASHKRYVVDN